MNGQGSDIFSNGHDKAHLNGHAKNGFSANRDNQSQPPPVNHDLEQLLLAAIMVDNKRLADVVSTLRPEHFGYDRHQRLFKHMQVLIGLKVPAVPQTIAVDFPEWDDYLRKLGRSAVSCMPSAVDHWSREIINSHYARRMWAIEIPDILSGQAKEPSLSPRLQGLWGEIETVQRAWQQDLPPAPLTRINFPGLPDALDYPTEWLVPDWLPMGETCGIGGAGGRGKTRLVQQLATSAALGGGGVNAWLGMPVMGMKAAMVLCEDTYETAYMRQKDINRRYGCVNADLADLWLMPRRTADSNYLATFDKNTDEMTLTPFFHQLLAELKEFGARLVVLDTLADLFRGDQNNPVHAREFIRGCCNKLARELNGIVLLVYHPSIRGMKDSDLQFGSVQWDAAYRARVILTGVEETEKEQDDRPGTRFISLIKNNFAPADEKFKIHWNDGIWVRKPPPQLASASPAYQQAADLAKWRGVFKKLLDKYKQQGRKVSSAPGKNYAPKIFAANKDSDGITEDQFRQAMEDLFEQNEIWVGRKGQSSWLEPKTTTPE